MKSRKRQQRQAAERTGARRGRRARREINLERIVYLRKLGLDTIADIARSLGVPKQTLLNARHADEVKEAMERGRVAAKAEALEQYDAAIASKNGNLSALLIFKLKQFGWTDRHTVDGAVEVTEGVRERVRDAVERLREKWRKEGAS